MGENSLKKHLITVHGACIVFIVSIISEAAGQWLREQAEELQVRDAEEQVQTIMVPAEQRGPHRA